MDDKPTEGLLGKVIEEAAVSLCFGATEGEDETVYVGSTEGDGKKVGVGEGMLVNVIEEAEISFCSGAGVPDDDGNAVVALVGVGEGEDDGTYSTMPITG